MGRHGLENPAPCPHARILADLDVAEHLGTCRKHDATANLRVTVAHLFPRSAQRHTVKHRDIVFDDGGFTDHDSGRVVHHDAAADLCSRMDIDGEKFRNAALQEMGEWRTTLHPQPVCDAMALQCMKSL